MNCWDFAMAFGIRKSFAKALAHNAHRAARFSLTADDVDEQALREQLAEVTYTETDDARTATVSRFTNLLAKVAPSVAGQARQIYLLSCEDVEDETRQAMEAAIHNLNSMHSRAGAQTPFSSLNYGMDTSPEGRLATRMTLLAVDAGLGHGETAIFPISVFQLKAGVNYNPGDPNYDLFKLACRVSAKRLFPRRNWGVEATTTVAEDENIVNLHTGGVRGHRTAC